MFKKVSLTLSLLILAVFLFPKETYAGWCLFPSPTNEYSIYIFISEVFHWLFLSVLVLFVLTVFVIFARKKIKSTISSYYIAGFLGSVYIYMLYNFLFFLMSILVILIVSIITAFLHLIFPNVIQLREFILQPFTQESNVWLIKLITGIANLPVFYSYLRNYINFKNNTNYLLMAAFYTIVAYSLYLLSNFFLDYYMHFYPFMGQKYLPCEF